MPPVFHAEPAPGKPARSPRTILLVDDEALVILASAMILKQTGYRVFEEHSAAGALSLLRGEELIDLLVTDFSMPGMDGGQLARASKELRPDLPILITSGYMNSTLGIGISHHTLGKPYLLNQLLGAIEKIIGKPQGG
ncbi:response regulator [Plastoroseomonas hellenica]|uniref:response regulator n=1 Tax=Plastoroseomonas hellenica TaxID=2687306 RepID=UPI001BA941D6|nr:response regulator [Plastoroseomonas hellenica]MBR0641435.1 response regulator [Plastoroseomonas hellenica]